MDKLVWQLPLGARFEFERLDDEQVVVRYYDHEQEKNIEETYTSLIPALAFAANMILKAYIYCGVLQEAEAKEGMH